MQPIALFLVLVTFWLAIALLRRWPWMLAALHAVGFAAALTLVASGDQIALPYTYKASLVALGAVASTWALDRISTLRTSVPTA